MCSITGNIKKHFCKCKELPNLTFHYDHSQEIFCKSSWSEHTAPYSVAFTLTHHGSCTKFWKWFYSHNIRYHKVYKHFLFCFLYLFANFFYVFFIVIQLQLCAFSPHPSTPPQPKPPPSPTSTLPLDFVHVSFIVVPVIPVFLFVYMMYCIYWFVNIVLSLYP